MRLAFTVSFNGKNYSGFQIQPDAKTIQEELEKAASLILREKVKVITSGRTDTGVSSLGLVFHIEIKSDTAMKTAGDIPILIYSLNSVLPPDISIIFGKEVPDDFHARFSALSREYAYFIYNAPYRNAAFSSFSLWMRKELDLESMKAASEILIGEKDFAAFTRGIYLKSTHPTIRRIDQIEVIKQDPFIAFYYKGSGFLHNMIRIITGTLLKTGKGELDSERVEEILMTRRRENAGATLPPYPLFFINAEYEHYSTPKKHIPFYSFFMNNHHGGIK